MSLSVVGTNNSFALLQSLWQPGSANGTQTQSDPMSALLTAVDQQSAGGTTSGDTTSGNGTDSSSSTALTAAGTALQFSPQTLQALLALQDDGANSQSLAAQFEDAANGTDPLSVLQSGQSHGQHHHHHHQMGVDGSTTTDAQSGGSAPSGTSNPSAGGNATGSNLIEQLTQMQAQLITPPNTQSLVTA